MRKGFQKDIFGMIASRPNRIGPDEIHHDVLVDERSAQLCGCDRAEHCHRLAVLLDAGSGQFASGQDANARGDEKVATVHGSDIRLFRPYSMKSLVFSP